MDMCLSKLREFVMDREAWSAEIHGVTKSWTRLSDWTELNWTKLKVPLRTYVHSASTCLYPVDTIFCPTLFQGYPNDTLASSPSLSNTHNDYHHLL